jgi:ABC-2 type transport system permease protein
MQALRHKEWALLRRDPWLASQTLMQVLYLIPPAVLLWRSYADSTTGYVILVPILVMAIGQLAGGLAWLAISGEDAPDLVATAPISRRATMRAKIEAVLAVIMAVAAPMIVGLLLLAPWVAFVAAVGLLAASTSAITIQMLFRGEARRAQFRRRQTASRAATFSEAFSSILWAGAAALAAAGSWFAIVLMALALMVLGVAWLISPQGDR